MHAIVSKLEAALLDALARDTDVHPSALQFLLRRFQTTGADELGDALGRGLARALTVDPKSESIQLNAARLVLFVETAALSDDERLIPAVRGRVVHLRPAWSAPDLIEATLASGACVHAACIATFHDIAADVVDALEQTIGRCYRPGSGVGGGAGEVYAAAALLAGYGLSARLPYSMLAEELIQSARTTTLPFDAACEAARVLCRLATLHDAPEYRAAAVVAPGVDYRQDAAAILDRLAPAALAFGTRGSIYGLAHLELESSQCQQIAPP